MSLKYYQLIVAVSVCCCYFTKYDNMHHRKRCCMMHIVIFSQLLITTVSTFGAVDLSSAKARSFYPLRNTLCLSVNYAQCMDWKIGVCVRDDNLNLIRALTLFK